MAKRMASARVRGLADIRQGTHLCQFYRNRKDLLDVLVPFFREGLESREFCLWITSDPLGRLAARRALREAVPGLDALLAAGQVKLVDHGDWYRRNGSLDAAQLARAFISEIELALEAGFGGVRIAANFSWLDRKDWSGLTQLEEGADRFVSGRPVRVICSYPLNRCGAVEVLDVVRSHHSVIVREDGQWRLVKSSGQQTIRRLLKDTEREYEHLFANVLDGLLVFDMETMKVVLANQAAAAITGFSSPDELEKVDMNREIGGADRDRLLSLLSLAQREEHSPVVEGARMVARDGREVWVDVVCRKIDYQGRPAALVALREVTDRKRAEEELLASQETNRVLIENANEAIVVIQDEVLKFANPRTEELFGCPAEDLMSRRVTEVIHPDDRQTVMDQHFRRLRGDGAPPVHEFRIVDSAGGTKWVELNGVLLAWEDRPADLCFLRDISGRKAAEEALHQSEERFRNLVENTSDWVWEVDTAGTYTYVAPRVRDILGYEPEEVVGKTPFHFMASAESARIQRIFRSCVSEKKPFAFLENVCLHRDGHAVYMEKSGVPFFDASGRVCGFRGIDRDITARKLVEERLQESYRKLQETLDGVIQAMALTVETRDRHTAGHQRRVTELAQAIAAEIGLPVERSRAVSIAGMLHDLGKITIPTEILSKPGRLTAMEFAIVKTHPKAGYDILKNIEFPWPVAEIVVQHHERLDGSGYPSGLTGEQSTLEARILAVADVVEAMASHRPYRPALGIDRALGEIRGNRGRLYDTEVADACLGLFGRGVFRFADQGV